jgi:hypothetical protein
MIVAVIVDGKVTNLIVCESVELAQQLLPGKLCVPGEGLKIGDTVEIQQPESEDRKMRGQQAGVAEPACPRFCLCSRIIRCRKSGPSPAENRYNPQG